MLRKAIGNLGSLTGMRVLSRLFHFLIKTYLIRTQLNEDVLAHLLNLELVLTTSLHLAKACLKPSYQKVTEGVHMIQSGMNIMTLGIGLTAGSAAIVGAIQYYQFSNSAHPTPHFPTALLLYCCATVCDAAAEKYMVHCVLNYMYLRIGLVEVASIVPKTIFLLAATWLGWFQSYAMLVFGAGQFIYSFALMAIFWVLSPIKNPGVSGWNNQSGTKIWVDPESRKALKQFGVMSVLKLVLHEFEKIVLVVMDVSHISSTYSLISNLGSMVVRYLFGPLSQIIFNYFSRGTLKDSLQALVSFIKALTVLSLLILSFSYNYSSSLLQMLYGERWVTQDSVTAMRTYMILVIFLGYNGVIEAFLLARGKDSISKYNYCSVLTTALYLTATVAFIYMDLGATGLFLGNIINMALRITVCWILQIKTHLPLSTLISQAIPSPFYLITTLALFFVCHSESGWAQSVFTHPVLNMGLGGCLAVTNMLPLLIQNRKWIVEEYRQRLLGRRQKQS